MLMQSQSTPVPTCPRCQEHSAPSSPSLVCSLCSSNIHLECLSPKAAPALKGDTFFSLNCNQCSSNETDEVTRNRISWLGATLLSLYHLHITNTSSNLGFYHWRNDIALLIATHWSSIFGHAVKKKKTWQGSVSGSLSGNSSTLFESGLSTIGEQGWWRLRSLDPPAIQLRRMPPKVLTSKPSKPLEKVQEVLSRRGERGSCSSLALAIERKKARDGLVAIPRSNKREKMMKRKRSETKGRDYSRDEYIEGKEEDSKATLSRTSNIIHQNPDNSLRKVFRLSSLPPSRISPSKGSSEEAPPSISALFPSQEPPTPYSPLPLSSPRQSPSDTPLLAETATKEEMEGFDIDEAVVSSLLEERKECDSPRSCNSPFKPELYIEGNPSPGSMNAAPHEVKAPLEISDRFAPTDEDSNQYNRIPQVLTEGPSTSRSDEKDHIQVLDRFQHSSSSGPTSTCLSLVVEKSVTNWSISPYSGKRLSPYIRRDTETEPAGLAVLRSLDKFSTRLHPIDFCYLQPQLVPAVNCLAEKLFWPGIDLEEGLQFPDFSCVALYKKLCIGFGLVVPDCRWSESYLSHLAVHPAWRNQGIATFMLYHLIQTNLGKDLTLHVSASNPALLLYQKFGFKVEEFVSNFYTRYLPPDSQQSPNALFLRLAR